MFHKLINTPIKAGLISRFFFWHDTCRLTRKEYIYIKKIKMKNKITINEGVQLTDVQKKSVEGLVNLIMHIIAGDSCANIYSGTTQNIGLQIDTEYDGTFYFNINSMGLILQFSKVNNGKVYPINEKIIFTVNYPT